MKNTFVTLFLSIFFLNAALYAQQDDFVLLDPKVTTQLNLTELSKGISTFQASFTQQKFISYLSATVESEGKIFFQNPKLVCWQYSTPYQFSIIINDGAVKLKDSNKKMEFKTQENSLFEQLGSIIESTLTTQLDTKNDFSIQYYQNQSFSKLQLVPNNKEIKAMITKAEIYISRNTNQLTQFKFFEPGGDHTVILFSNIIENKTIDPSVFR